MAKHHKRHSGRRRHHRRNPFGIGGGAIKDAAFNAVGAIGAITLANMAPSSFSTGWGGVAATAVAAVAESYLAKMVVGAAAAEEILKGGLVATIIRAANTSGVFGRTFGLSSYVRSQFAVPTASDPYGRVLPPPPPAVTMKGLGASRFRSRYN